MASQFGVNIEQDSEGYLIGSVPALPGCQTQAKSLDVLMELMKESIELCLEVTCRPAENLILLAFSVSR